MKQFLSLILISALFSCSHSNDNYGKHEECSIDRYNKMQDSLNKYVKNRDTVGLRLLSAQLDTQMKLEDFLIKFREVDQIKWTLLLSTGILTAIVSIITTLITLFIKQYPRKHTADVIAKVP